jgi:cobalt-zinc-cadmium efflux system outer membrane protein
LFSYDDVVVNHGRKFLSALAISIWMLNQSAMAAPIELSLDQALRQAQESSPILAAANRLTGIAQGERQQAGLLPNPELSWGVEDTRSNSRITNVQIVPR